MKELETDILIVGGGVGGCAAALAAASMGRKVVLTEESDWIGGQLTSQATPPDEHGWIEHFGCTRTYRRMRDGVRRYYRENYPLTPDAASDPLLNPGNGWVSPLCAEPIVFLKVLRRMLSDYTESGQLTVLTEHIPYAADVDADKIRSVALRHIRGGGQVSISAKYFIDATELGELLPITGTEFVTGSEAAAETGEPSAKDAADPQNSQAFSMCFALSHYAGEDNTIERPSSYDRWRGYVPDLTPAWSGHLLSLDAVSPRTMQPLTYNFKPHGEADKAFSGLWNYRRVLDRKKFIVGAFASDITIVNYPQIDYFETDLSNAADHSEKLRSIDEAKQLSLSFLYWLQTEGGYAGLKLRPDVTGSPDGLAKMPYVRESRRIKAEFTICEQDVAAACLPGQTHARRFDDSVGIGYYRIDLHPTLSGDNYVDVEALPFQIPLGSLIPRRTENLLAGCKNIGTTHITNGCYRVHPVEWNIGEAAGVLAAFCCETNATPHGVRNEPARLRAFQQRLNGRGVELEWPSDLDLKQGDPHRHAL